MSVVTLGQESRDRKALDGTSFYVPYFEVKIEGVGLPRDVLRDVTQLTYKDDVKGLDSVELTVNNWDSTTNQFKYVGAETPDSLQGNTRESQRFRLFEPCGKNIEVSMGYVGDLRLMLKGTFTTMEPNFPASGAPTLTVRGLNGLHSLRRKRYSNPWRDKKDSEIAETIGTLRDGGRRRFPFPIVIDQNAKNREPRIIDASQQNQYDIDYLYGRARQRGYVIFLQEADRRRPQRLYFGPSIGSAVPGLRDVTYRLEWGKALVDFKPTLSTANRVRSLTVRGWNRTTRQRIRETATIDDMDTNRDLYRFLDCADPREDQVVNEPVFDEHQALQRARALLRENLKRLVTASGSTVGLPDLRAGQTVQIEGVGSRFSGIYAIDDTTHTINDSGYITRFNVHRERSLP
jgi:phage protein D